MLKNKIILLVKSKLNYNNQSEETCEERIRIIQKKNIIVNKFKKKCTQRRKQCNNNKTHATPVYVCRKWANIYSVNRYIQYNDYGQQMV